MVNYFYTEFQNFKKAISFGELYLQPNAKFKHGASNFLPLSIEFWIKVLTLKRIDPSFMLA